MVALFYFLLLRVVNLYTFDLKIYSLDYIDQTNMKSENDIGKLNSLIIFLHVDMKFNGKKKNHNVLLVEGTILLK